MTALVLKRASASRPSGEWNDDDYDVLADGAVVGRILKLHAAPVGSPWMWTLAVGQHEDCTWVRSSRPLGIPITYIQDRVQRAAVCGADGPGSFSGENSSLMPM